ncbi:MAG: hypothetical protein ACREEM_32450 [Blastocatellia bacterium]
MANFPQEIASFPFYSTFHQILMAGVNANQAAQLPYVRNFQMIAFQPPATPPAAGNSTVFQLSGPLNYVEFDTDLDVEEAGPPAAAGGPPTVTTRKVKKHVKVPLIAVVDVRPMAIDLPLVVEARIY